MLDRIIQNIKRWFLPCEDNRCKPKFLESRFLAYFAISALILKIAVVSIFVYLPKTAFFADLTKTSLIELANEARQSSGSALLEENPTLNQAALMKAKDMLDNDYFSHISPEGITPWHWFSQSGYDYKYAGENLAIGFLDSGEVSQAWLDSPSHRENILNSKYSEIGIAVLKGDFEGRETTVVVQLFGAPKAQLALSDNNAETPLPNSENKENADVLAETENTNVAIVSNQPREVLSAFRGNEGEKSFAASIFNFIISDYYSLAQRIIYGSFLFIFALLVITVFFDIFVYRAYEIQYKDILLKTLGFCAILFILFLIDKDAIIQIIPHNFGIY
jgi:hypothetical protein